MSVAKPQRGDLTKPRPTAWVISDIGPFRLRQALKGRNKAGNLSRPYRAGKAYEFESTALTQAVGLGFVRSPLWGLRRIQVK
jgi:hypothetical protein